ncbi:hypothetical protein BKP45_07185 [Anaerobacillus alkalidiazotrophicus]|uniref:Uncharacterized protein n=1 Tax=Anaerobacillus alkalidiazotrophicus TaxID=472963 RepID=A0A1S2MCS4_9BACI|nr:hypothetical protein [Anaerobacillus alkalidiazotrophicus]OIJ22410.1 hypothetical protein BKP45_07185 [Anaerobacillus alkalidiazotrophicus]
MKKKVTLVLSSILLSIGLLVGCSGDPGFEEDQSYDQAPNEGTETNELEIDLTEDEAPIDVEVNIDGEVDEFFDEELDEEEQN